MSIGRSCAVSGCTTNEKTKSSKIRLFSIPSEYTQDWRRVINKPDYWLPRPNSKICSLHFTPGDIVGKKLRPGALPQPSLPVVFIPSDHAYQSSPNKTEVSRKEQERPTPRRKDEGLGGRLMDGLQQQHGVEGEETAAGCLEERDESMEGVEVKETMVAGGEGHSNPTIEWTEDNGCLVYTEEVDDKAVLENRKVKNKMTVAAVCAEDKAAALHAMEELRGKGATTKDLICRLCDPPRSFTAYSTLLTHYRSHAGLKPFECSICQATFTRQHSLNYHLMTHENKTRFNCPNCNKKFRHSFHFKEHMKKHVAAVQFNCTLCETVVGTLSILRKHLKTKHNKIIHTNGSVIDCPQAMVKKLKDWLRDIPLDLEKEEEEYSDQTIQNITSWLQNIPIEWQNKTAVEPEPEKEPAVVEPEPEGEPVNIVLLEDSGEMSEIKQEAEDEHNPIDPLSMDFESGEAREEETGQYPNIKEELVDHNFNPDDLQPTSTTYFIAGSSDDQFQPLASNVGCEAITKDPGVLKDYTQRELAQNSCDQCKLVNTKGVKKEHHVSLYPCDKCEYVATLKGNLERHKAYKQHSLLQNGISIKERQRDRKT